MTRYELNIVLEHGCQSKNERLLFTYQKPSTRYLSICCAGFILWDQWLLIHQSKTFTMHFVFLCSLSCPQYKLHINGQLQPKVIIPAIDFQPFSYLIHTNIQ